MREKLTAYKRKFVTLLSFICQYNKWMKLRHKSVPINSDKNKIVLIPCDPWTVGGSRGDEAMLMAIIQYYTTKNKNVSIAIVSDNQKGEKYVNDLKLNNVYALPVWYGKYPAENIYDAVMKCKPNTVVILGADCMDGFYSPALSLTLLTLHDLFSYTVGTGSKLMGFSFNETPYRPLCHVFRNVSSDTRFNLRDEVSLRRFMEKTGISAGLVADVAFLLQADADFNDYALLEKWVKSRKDSGSEYIIGINFHPMLRKYNNTDDIRHDALIVAQNLKQILELCPTVALALIPHDNRDLLTDNLVLSTIAEYLNEYGFKDRITYSSKVFRAAQLKAVCGLLDGIVSSRMHLAIAALGQGKSILAASYQGKFDGLFRHFHLPCEYLLRPEQFISEQFVPIFQKFINELHYLNKQVAARLPEVIKLSEKNLI